MFISMYAQFLVMIFSLFHIRPCDKDVELQSGGLSTSKYACYENSHCFCPLGIGLNRRYERAFVFFSSSLCAAVGEAAALASVTLRPLEGVEAVDVAPARNGETLGALLKLCNGWQKPKAVLRGRCFLVSRTRFEVDIGYHVDVVAAFKQMATKSYGNRLIM